MTERELVDLLNGLRGAIAAKAIRDQRLAKLKLASTAEFAKLNARRAHIRKQIRQHFEKRFQEQVERETVDLIYLLYERDDEALERATPLSLKDLRDLIGRREVVTVCPHCGAERIHIWSWLNRSKPNRTCEKCARRLSAAAEDSRRLEELERWRREEELEKLKIERFCLHHGCDCELCEDVKVELGKRQI